MGHHGTSNQAWLEGSQQHSSSHEVEGCGNPLPGNRKPRCLCGLHREAGAADGKGFCWGPPPHVACEVPELKINVGPNPTLHQEQLTVLLETQLCSTWVFFMAGTLLPSSVFSKRTLSQFLCIHRNFHLQVWYTWNTHRESVKYTISSKNPSRSTLFEVNSPAIITLALSTRWNTWTEPVTLEFSKAVCKSFTYQKETSLTREARFICSVSAFISGILNPVWTAELPETAALSKEPHESQQAQTTQNKHQHGRPKAHPAKHCSPYTLPHSPQISPTEPDLSYQ